MGLIEDSFHFKNIKPNQKKSWSAEDAILAWKLFIDGLSYAEIGLRVGKNVEAIAMQMKNQLRNLHRHPDTAYPGDRSFLPWKARDAWTLRRALAYNRSVELVARLLGRPLAQIEEQVR